MAAGRGPSLMAGLVKRVQVANPYLTPEVMWNAVSPTERILPNYQNTVNRTFQPADRRLFETDPNSYLATFSVTHMGSASSP